MNDETNTAEWAISFIGDLEPGDGNVDVFVRFRDGREYVATFFTLENLRVLMEGYRKTGENANGSYVWSTQMIVVEALAMDIVDRAVRDLLSSGDFEVAFTRTK